MSEIDQYIAILKQNVTGIPLFFVPFSGENYEYRNQIASSCCIMCLFLTYCASIMNDEALVELGKMMSMSM